MDPRAEDGIFIGAHLGPSGVPDGSIRLLPLAAILDHSLSLFELNRRIIRTKDFRLGPLPYKFPLYDARSQNNRIELARSLLGSNLSTVSIKNVDVGGRLVDVVGGRVGGDDRHVGDEVVDEVVDEVGRRDDAVVDAREQGGSSIIIIIIIFSSISSSSCRSSFFCRR